MNRDRTEWAAFGKTYSFADLAQACEAAASASLSDLPDILPAAEPSKAFSKRVERLHRKYLRGLRLAQFGRTAAGIALALLLTFSAVITANAQARNAFLAWWQRTSGSSVAYWYGRESDAGKTGSYQLSLVPEGMQAVRRTESEGFSSTVYEGSGHLLVFEYSGGEEAGAFEVFEAGEGIPVEVGGLPGRLFAENGRISLIWMDEAASVVFTISSDLDVQTVLQAAESVKGY